MEQTQISSWLSDFETKLSYATNDSERNTAYADAIPIGADLASCMADYWVSNLNGNERAVFDEEQRLQFATTCTPPIRWNLEVDTDNHTTTWVRRDKGKRYLSYQARRNIRESRMRESSDFTDTESKALDEFFAEMSVAKERSDAD